MQERGEVSWTRATSREGVVKVIGERRLGITLLFAMAAAACGSSDGVEGGTSACEAGTEPVLLSFELESGEPLWWSCSAVRAHRWVVGTGENTVFLFEQDSLVAFDATAGGELWRNELAADEFLAGAELGPFAGGGIVVVRASGADTDIVIGVDEHSGEQLWQQPDEVAQLITKLPGGGVASNLDGSPLVGSNLSSRIAHTEETVVLDGAEGLRGLERRTGRELWRSGAASGVQVIVAGTVIATSTDITMGTAPATVGLDAETGVVLWQQLGGLYGWYAGERSLVAQASGSTVSVVDPMTGEVRWTEPVMGLSGGHLAIGSDVLVAGGASIVGFDLASGEARWRLDARPDTDTSLGAPHVARGDTAYLLGDGAVRAISTLDGSTRWVAPTLQGGLESSVGLDADHVFVSVNTLPWYD